MTRALIAGWLLLVFGCGGATAPKGVRNDIRAKMTSAEPALARCYADALTANPELSGTADVSFLIAAKTGKFEKVMVRTKLAPGLKDCVARAVQGLKLEAAPPLPIVVASYPLEFTKAAP